MDEITETRVLANKILDRINGDPDDDLAMLSRQLLRADEQLHLVDEALARRPAVADAPNRYTAICSAFEMASRAQKAEAMEKHWKFHYDKSVEQLQAQQERIAALEQWKREQLMVESEWDAQAVGRELGIGLGESIRAEILPAVLALRASLQSAQETLQELRALLNTPETEDFDKAIPLEAAHQIERWGSAQDAGKSPADWFWLVGYLAGKALTSSIAGNTEKAKHHCVSTAAVLRNWHAHIRSGESLMRPGIAEEKTAGLNPPAPKEPQ